MYLYDDLNPGNKCAVKVVLSRLLANYDVCVHDPAVAYDVDNLSFIFYFWWKWFIVKIIVMTLLSTKYFFCYVWGDMCPGGALIV